MAEADDTAGLYRETSHAMLIALTKETRAEAESIGGDEGGGCFDHDLDFDVLLEILVCKCEQQART